MNPRLWLLGLLCAPTTALAQNVLWYHGNGGTISDTTAFETHVTQTLGGTVGFEDDWSTVTLGDHQIVFVARPTAPLDSGQQTDLDDYLVAGGTVVLVGDSLAAGQPQIDALNALMTGLGVTMQLESTALATNGSMCLMGNVINGSDLMAPSNPLSVITMGDIDPGSGTILLGYSEVLGTVVTSADLVVQEERVVLTADYDFFSSDACGLPAKQAFWTSLFTYACDSDDDGLLALACGGNDCDDTTASVGAFGGYPDADLDGFGDDDGYVACETGDTDVGGDCDDADPDSNPEGVEVCDGADNDCNGFADDDAGGDDWFPDDDGDGFGEEGSSPVAACDAPSGHVDNAGDCNDGNATVNPSAPEVCNNIADDDCDGQVDEDCQTIIITEDKPCGCSSGSAGGFGAVLLVVAGLIRRRGRR